MKDEMPLTDRDLADIRASVMRTIEARESRRRWAAVCAMLVFAIIIATRPDGRTSPSAPPRPARLVATRPAGEGAGAPQRTNTKVVAHHHHRRRHREEPTPIRVELATSDPDIRIIWITNTNESQSGETR